VLSIQRAASPCLSNHGVVAHLPSYFHLLVGHRSPVMLVTRNEPGCLYYLDLCSNALKLRLRIRVPSIPERRTNVRDGPGSLTSKRDRAEAGIRDKGLVDASRREGSWSDSHSPTEFQQVSWVIRGRRR
jgi:hypothetical protein